MGLDILLFRKEKGGNPELVRESQRRRNIDVSTVDHVISLDQAWRQKRHDLDMANGELKAISKQVGERKKKKESADDLFAQISAIKEKIAKYKKEEDDAELEMQKCLDRIGNIVHESVPVSNDEENNKVVDTWGKFEQTETAKEHHDLLYMIDGYDAPRGTRVALHRGYFLKGWGVKLNLALINYGVDFLQKRNFTPLQTPFFMQKELMAKTAQLEDFDEALYKISTGKEGEDFYLIATSEQPISAYHAEEWLEEKDLPFKYAGVSTCFRKEAGAHGKDVTGIFRVHQFDKVEQFCITAPEKSWDMLEEMTTNSKEFFQSLGIPYRVVTIVSGALNNAASKKYDLEGWFPGSGKHRELVSCSNCTDYQSRSLGVRCGQKKKEQTEKRYVHMLNGTLCATTRVICAILENYQTDKGINIPDVLQNYLGGAKFIPFVHEAPKIKAEAKASGASGSQQGACGSAKSEDK